MATESNVYKDYKCYVNMRMGNENFDVLYPPKNQPIHLCPL